MRGRWTIRFGTLALLGAAVLAVGPGQAAGQGPPARPPAPEVTSPESPVPEAPDANAPDVTAPDGPESGPEAPQPGPIAVDAEGVERIRVDADHFETYEDTAGARLVIASGNVRAEVTRDMGPDKPPSTAVITADTMSANMDTRILTARGHVLLTSGERTATGEEITYRWQEGTGRVTGVFFHQYGLTFRAGALDIQAGRQVVYDAAFSTCGLEDPDFRIRASRITIVPDKRITARGVVVELFRHRVIRLQRLEYRLRKGQARGHQALPVVRPGYSRTSGLSLAQPLPLGRNLDAEIEPTTRAGLRGRVMYANEGFLTPYAEIALRQEESVRGRRPVLVSRLPVVGLRFGPDGDLSAGYFHEHGTGTQEGRLNAALDWPLFERGTRPGLDLTVGGRVSFYTTGENYRDVHVRAAVGRGGPDTFEEIGLQLNDVGGHTPFLWDRVQVRTEVFGAKRIALGSFRLEGALRWDLDRSEIYDLQVAVARRYRCVEPEIRYSSRRESIMLGLKVFGIGADAEEDLPRVVAPPVESPPVSRSSGPVPVPGR